MKITRRFFGEENKEVVLEASLRGSHMNNPNICFAPDGSLSLVFEMEPEVSSEHSMFIEVFVDREDLNELKSIYDLGLV